MNISPKVYVPVAITILAAVALYLITGDKTFLVTILLSLASGGAGVKVAPAPNVTQKEIARISAARPRR